MHATRLLSVRGYGITEDLADMYLTDRALFIRLQDA